MYFCIHVNIVCVHSCHTCTLCCCQVIKQEPVATYESSSFNQMQPTSGCGIQQESQVVSDENAANLALPGQQVRAGGTHVT